MDMPLAHDMQTGGSALSNTDSKNFGSTIKQNLMKKLSQNTLKNIDKSPITQ